ncbi:MULTISPECIES: autotransporter outer membrane beta-barrel domain-containing protein [Campylobacter]|uniref:autotransporter outer membrane beta-barrel domain-containing protein n=1 Tax=Campylobacter TaxID=194 RepID=UPI001F47C193|nr:autotransporter outer membrane beta-barrel domain-containing protein [Campylobacter sp. P0024]MCR8679318.1 autotransporter outer membrane beta-barrel domain-containing protein [Campylobacter sp. RM19072]
MKLSLIASRAILGLGVLGSVSICAQELTTQTQEINARQVLQNNNPIAISYESQLKDYFDIEIDSSRDAANLVFKEGYKDTNLKINSALEDFVPNSVNRENTFVTIDLGNGVLDLINVQNGNGIEKNSHLINADITASQINVTDMNLDYFRQESTLSGNVKLTGTRLPADSDDFGSTVRIVSGGLDKVDYNGGLTIWGNLEATKTRFEGVGNGSLNFDIKGNANIKESNFSVISTSFNNLILDRFVFASANSFNSDVTTSNTAGASILNSIYDIVSDENLANQFIEIEGNAYLTPMDAGDFVNYKLSVEKGSDKEYLIVNGGVNSTKINSTKEILTFEKEHLEKIIRVEDLANSQNPVKQAILKDLQAQIAKREEILNKINSSDEESLSTEDKMGAMGIEITNTTKHIFEKVSNLNGAQADNYKFLLTTGIMGGATNTAKTADSMQTSGNLNEAQGIFDSLINSNINAKVGIDAITNKDFFKDVRESAKNSTDILNNTSSANGAMNISNDMALGDRIARINNPYSEVRFANVLKSSLLANSTNIASDAIYDYYGTKTYKDSVWGNTFGGANIIDGESGGLYGISIGADKEFNENLLLGIYATYANSKIKDKLSVQESDNYQIGIYSSYRFNYSWELNSKLYGQIGDTKQDINLAGSLNNADFNRKFVGLNTSIGKVFNLESDLFLKPFVGVNYYYSHTPSYDEKGILARKVESNTNNSLSLELGLESRKYFNESSYLFITPKIEQYVVNNGEDYVASFVGSNTSFSIKGEEKKKTYGQLIIGGNISLNDSLSLDVGIGAKQILAGKVDSKNETYLSGNVGIKYRF